MSKPDRYLDGMAALAHVALLEASKLAESDPLGAAINARVAASCLAYEGWRRTREKQSVGAGVSPQEGLK